ncbi:hypothetical protein HFP89_12415 [Wenzhouxiangella sp. XN79A]|uniref:DUF6491 family protein n=1 Tax=Wenzhouxiangella sp. XN79A TaxID=2724193 RepID=UPI00144A4DC8|nr:DUF6491 family protein [Wenzhouxiangella sp. XN79A]NKI35966.1 hypothetical protein [Wenzhouxiangella sp. XN79A]
MATSFLKGCLALCAALVLTACAANRETEPTAPFMQFVGEPERSIGFSQLVDWRVLDRDWVMLRVNRNRFFAVQLMQPCIADAREAIGMRLVQGSAGRLTTADRVVLQGRDCRIARIAPFDHAGWREAIVTDR